MVNNNRIQVSEFVGRGHPDKLADYIADRLLEVALLDDPYTHLGIEVLTTNKYICVVGEYRSSNECTSKDFIEAIKQYLYKFYTGQYIGNININLFIQKQSKLINNTVKNWEIPDQGVSYGYADNTNENYLPYSHYVAQMLNKDLDMFVSTSTHEFTYDYKLLVETLENHITKIVLSICHLKNIDVESVRNHLLLFISSKCELHKFDFAPEYTIEINPGGEFTVGGLNADSGATNRKLMVDNYGCNIEHGGGGYSGKDISKPDRLFGYYARYIAKNVVASGLLN